MNYKLSFIVPAYNEQRTLGPLLARLLELNLEKELIVVDDGSTDGTRDVLEAISHPAVRILRHQTNRGKGAAVRTALPHCSGDIVVLQDADIEQKLTVIYELIRPILTEGIPVVYGSRFLGGGPRMKWTNYLANRFLSFLTSRLYSARITDVEISFKVFRADVLRSILPLESNGFEIEVEMTSKLLKKGIPIREVAIKEEWCKEHHHDSKKLSWTDGVKAVAALFKYRLNS
jgi:glycosyltransferase involved in cell wall biosynthesis